jgi:hypothetical protein
LTSKYVIAVALAAVSTSFAGNIPVASVTASSTFGTYDVNHLIDGSGMSGGLADDNFHNMWMDSGGSTPTLVFDLGAVYTLGSTSIWNYNADCCGLDRSVQSLNILVSTDDVTFTPVGSFSGLPEGTGNPIPADVLNLSGAIGRWVEFDITSNYGADYTGLSEVEFSTDTGQVPEPASGLLVLAGVAVGFIYRRRMAA